MSEPVSPHTPILAGATVSVTASLEIDTGLREIQTFVANLVTGSAPGAEEGLVTWAQTSVTGTGNVKVTLYVWKTGGTAGDSAVNVSWLALGK